MNEDKKDEVVQLYLDDIIPNRFQPREVFDERALKELAVSIREHGVIQPIIVRNVNGKYEIIAGERRYKASALAGMTKIPAIIRDLDDKESSKVALLENLQRKNLNPIEEARTYQKILELDEMTQEELAKTMGKSQSSVANKIRLLSLSDEIQDALLKEQISERHARALLNVTDSKVQQDLLKEIVDTKMSVRALEDKIKELYPKDKDASEIPVELDAIASASGFLDNSPLTPTTSEIKEEVDNYGKVTIVPPTENETPANTSKFVTESPSTEKEDNDTTMPQTTTTVNVDEIKKNATSINPVPAAGAALDNLLNINTTKPVVEQPSNGGFELPDAGTFQIPQEEKEEKDENFKEIPSIVLPNTETSAPISDASQSAIPEITTTHETYTIEMATAKIKELIEDFKNHGISVTADEMNFPKSYQVIIKIDKPQ